MSRSVWRDNGSRFEILAANVKFADSLLQFLKDLNKKLWGVWVMDIL